MKNKSDFNKISKVLNSLGFKSFIKMGILIVVDNHTCKALIGENETKIKIKNGTPIEIESYFILTIMETLAEFGVIE